MKIDKYKGIDNVLAFLLIFFPVMAILAYPIAYWPHYEKKVYEKQEPLTWESMEELARMEEELYGISSVSGFSGYPTEGMNTELTSDAKFQYEDRIYEDTSSIFTQLYSESAALEQDAEAEIYCLEVDGNDLEPTGIYERVYEFSVSSGSTSGGIRRNVSSDRKYAERYVTSYLKTVLNRNKAIYAQYYALSLDDGSRILVLLNDTLIEIPKTGSIQLPLARESWLSFDDIETKKKDVISKYNINFNESLNETKILDAATDWLYLNEDIKKANENRRILFLILICTGIGGTMITFLGSVLLLKRAK